MSGQVQHADFEPTTTTDYDFPTDDGAPKKTRQRKPIDEMTALTRTLRLLTQLDPTQALWVLDALTRKFKNA